MTDVTTHLKRWQDGEQDALNDLLKLLTPELRKSAVAMVAREGSVFRLQPTELINEAMIRLMDVDQIDWKDRAHFLAIAAITMRRVLVDEARRHNAAKRARVDVTLGEGVFASNNENPGDKLDVLMVDEALQELHALFPDRCRIVELKFFAGMTNEDIAEVEGISVSTVKRHWRTARAWMLEYLSR